MDILVYPKTSSFVGRKTSNLMTSVERLWAWRG